MRGDGEGELLAWACMWLAGDPPLPLEDEAAAAALAQVVPGVGGAQLFGRLMRIRQFQLRDIMEILVAAQGCFAHPAFSAPDPRGAGPRSLFFFKKRSKKNLSVQPSRAARW